MEFKSSQEQSPSNNQLIHNHSNIKSSIFLGAKSSLSNKKSHFQNGYATQKFYNRYAHSEYLLAGSVTVNLSMNVVYFQMSIDENQLKDWLVYMSLVFQLFSIITLILNYIAYNDYKTHQNNHYEIKKISELLFKSILILISPYPFLESYQITFQNQLRQQNHKVNHLLCLMSLLQIFLLAPCFFLKNKFQSIRSQRICEMYGFKATYIYGMKCWFKQNSVFAVMILFLFWFSVCAIGIRIAEYGNNPILQSFDNSVWLPFVTISTLGLGDLYPITNVGYVISTIAMYSGVMMVSIAIVLLGNTFKLNSRQKRSLKILKTLEEKNQLKVVASQYIRESLWRMWTNKKNQQFDKNITPSLEERNLKKQFKLLRRQSQSANFQNNIRDQFRNNFAKVYGYMDNLKYNQERMSNFLQHCK